MEAKEVLHIMRATAPAANLEDAAAFLELCRERGLTPFVEASPIVVDYTNRNGVHVHGLSVKEHYAVAERWAQQCGGYTVRLREIIKDGSGDIRARVGIVSNRDYVAIIQLCTRVPGVDFKEELASFMVIGEATLSAEEQRKPSPKGKSWEWLAEKRAREAAVLQKFGREPTQSRQMYTNALTVEQRREAAEALYPAAPQSALPAPVVHTETEPIEGEIVERAEAELVENTPPEFEQAAETTNEEQPSASMTLSDARSYFAAAFNAAKRDGKAPKPVNFDGMTVAQIIAAADAL